MKINEINVNAFRGFESYKKFNLLKNNNPVSIAIFYAPNGIGKTSLVEALEWNLTGQVERLTTLLNSYHNKPKEGYILKNKYSNKKRGCIDVYFDNKKYIKRETKLLTGNMNNDYSNGSCTTDILKYEQLNKKKIKQNILSQNNINDFLITASTGNIFNAFFGLDNNSDDLKIYHKIKNISNDISKAIKEKNQLKFKSIAASKKLSKEINKFKKESSVDFNEKIKIFLCSLSHYYNYDFGEIEHYPSLNVILEYIEDVRISALDIYNNHNNISSRIKKIRQKRKFIETFDYLTNCNKKKIELDNKSKKNEEKLLKYKNISNVIFSDDYQEYITEVSQINNIKNSISTRIIRTNKLIKSIKHSISILNINFYRSEEKNSTDKLNKFKYFINQISNFKNLKELNNEIDKIRDFINSSYNILRKISKNDIFSFNAEEIKTLNIKEQLDQISTVIKQRDDNTKAKQISLKRFQELNNIKSSLVDIKIKAKDIVNKTSESICPVCNRKYDSISDLVDSIDKEFKVIDEDLYNDIRFLDNKIKKTNDIIKQKKDILHNYIITSREIINREMLKSNSYKNLISDFKCFIETLEPNLINKDFAFISDHLKRITNGKHDVIIHLESRNKTLLKRKSLLTNILNENNNDLLELITRKKTNEYKLEVYGFKEVVNSIEFNNYRNNTKSLFSTIKNIESELSNIKSEINTIKLQLQSKTKKLKSEIFNDLSKTPIQEIRNSLSNEVKDLNNLKIKYKKLKGKVKELNFKKIMTTIDEVSSHSLNANSLINELNRQDKIKELNIKLSINKNEQDKLNKELKTLKDKNSSYSKALTDSQQFFSSLIDLKLNKKLLNDVFRIIDPHSTFKQLDIEIDMSKGNEKMHIKSNSTPEDNKSTSVLYFSEAQTNILSLSLFLSNHANSDCVINTLILDDPIQSMDDINAYSFIDLCRIYTKRFNKQLIITTHDRNFFELFKSRLPEDNFPCKYFNLLDDF